MTLNEDFFNNTKEDELVSTDNIQQEANQPDYIITIESDRCRHSSDTISKKINYIFNSYSFIDKVDTSVSIVQTECSIKIEIYGTITTIKDALKLLTLPALFDATGSFAARNLQTNNNSGIISGLYLCYSILFITNLHEFSSNNVRNKKIYDFITDYCYCMLGDYAPKNLRGEILDLLQPLNYLEASECGKRIKSKLCQQIDETEVLIPNNYEILTRNNPIGSKLLHDYATEYITPEGLYKARDMGAKVYICITETENKISTHTFRLNNKQPFVSDVLNFLKRKKFINAGALMRIDYTPSICMFQYYFGRMTNDLCPSNDHLITVCIFSAPKNINSVLRAAFENPYIKDINFNRK